VDKPISVLLASQFSVVRLGIVTYLKECTDVACKHQAESLQQAIERLIADNVDVAIIDLSLLKPSGLAELRLLIKQDPGLKY
jgi:DNA-binding NarL/FixJ family response regulator